MSSALGEVKRSAIREFSRMAAETPGCIALTLGEPDFDTPEPIRAAAERSLEASQTHYIANNGDRRLLEAIADFEREKNGMDYTADEIVVTAGATEAVFDALFGVLNEGDEVIVPVPAFGLYESIITMCRGRMVPLDISRDGFRITPEAIESLITDRTKAVILNSPNNPTGCILDEESLMAVHDAVKDREIFVICDDVYRQLIYTDRYESFASFRDLRDRIIVVQSFSKPYAMTGWRMGYLMADLPVKKHLELVHQYAVVSTPSFSQEACIEALKTDVTPMLEEYGLRREYMLERLAGMGLDTPTPLGAFYAFPSIRKFGMSSSEFCTRMIREALLAATPGECFGCDGYIRLTYCCSRSHLKEGLDRLERFVEKLEAEQAG